MNLKDSSTLMTRNHLSENIYLGKYVQHFFILHGPPMLVDKTNFGLVLSNHANFYRFEKTSSYWSVKRMSVFSAFHWSTRDTPPASQ